MNYCSTDMPGHKRFPKGSDLTRGGAPAHPHSYLPQPPPPSCDTHNAPSPTSRRDARQPHTMRIAARGSPGWPSGQPTTRRDAWQPHARPLAARGCSSAAVALRRQLGCCSPEAAAQFLQPRGCSSAAAALRRQLSCCSPEAAAPFLQPCGCSSAAVAPRLQLSCCSPAKAAQLLQP